jgi:hypothetical protein
MGSSGDGSLASSDGTGKQSLCSTALLCWHAATGLYKFSHPCGNVCQRLPVSNLQLQLYCSPLTQQMCQGMLSLQPAFTGCVAACFPPAGKGEVFHKGVAISMWQNSGDDDSNWTNFIKSNFPFKALPFGFKRFSGTHSVLQNCPDTWNRCEQQQLLSCKLSCKQLDMPALLSTRYSTATRRAVHSFGRSV